ncbi:MAG: thiol reductase thioredoxin [Gammaproteobacteria bacterium RIFOXYA12_FULL_61_12]|nr:MAG: thiol reductase thioredoxin [Gammaproteobacteria bacterium RIFOXYD12_FULL_61_37]OGT93981.1 MAG: thiol reductase thioredoxin [Gammaproteobacteria bacterium RIFOXYA12_FULL_61_12]
MFKFIRSLLLLPFLAAGAALAGGAPYDAAKFDALNAEGKPILIAIHADWCPTCQAQDPIISGLLTKPEFQGITAFRVDFDGQQEAVKRFKASMQSTLILFKGGKELGRSLGETRQDAIAALLKQAL